MRDGNATGQRSLRAEQTAKWLAVLAAGLTVALAVRYSTFVPWGTDPASYIESAHRWADGSVQAPSPLPLCAAWTRAGFVVAPHGFRAGVVSGTDVSQYPLGYPVLMAAAIRVGGDLAPYLVAPLCAGLLVWCTYLLGTRAGGPVAGLFAASVIGWSPVTLVFSMQPMSDVPAAAMWALAWVMSLRPGFGAAAAAGSAAAAAIMVRPNLVPLAGVLAVVVLLAGGRSAAMSRATWLRVVVFGSLAAMGLGLVAWSQAVLYGSPLTPGYLGWEDQYRAEHIRSNLTRYPSFLALAHTPVMFAGLSVPILVCWRRVRATFDRDALAVVVSATAIIVLTYALYLPFVPFDSPEFLRYMLPAIVGLSVLLACLLARVARSLQRKSRALGALALVPAAVVLLYPARFATLEFGIHKTQARVLLMGQYLREALPRRSVVLTSMQGGAIAHYTRAPVVRLDLVPPGTLEDILDDLERLGYGPVLVVDGGWELANLAPHLAGSRLDKPDWPPRSEFWDSVPFLYFELSDRDRFRQGSRWSTDVVRIAHP
jgi:hypothetical protein